ncbi:hypothetical protein Pcinc_006207 [Petrolisthes cinctipes]|uniref:Uncharacterized protein n=1 Tax=Petrolisthes cinctipes TaxID=88211 RepID=A0AAE1GDA4_PETCI|nr:hypothetical protein Pcinc_024985 [Petrolisthes cinctipes]KAK3889811.1 hypothetical protein Pcinc_006207 [Petrolisthes cinctipes]
MGSGQHLATSGCLEMLVLVITHSPLLEKELLVLWLSCEGWTRWVDWDTSWLKRLGDRGSALTTPRRFVPESPLAAEVLTASLASEKDLAANGM